MRSEISRWCVCLGVTGFLAGFVGPMALQPGANQGPMLGIFLTGPGGFAVGALLGAVILWLKVRPEVSRRLMIATCAVGASIILFFCLPKPEREATILDLEVRGCVPALDWTGRAFDNWERRLAINSWAKPPADWREHFHDAAANDSVVAATTKRRRDVLLSQMPWSRGQRSLAGWESGPGRRIFQRPEEFYVPGSCSGFATGVTGVFLAAKATNSEESYPPRDPSRFLDMVLLTAIPENVAAMAR